MVGAGGLSGVAGTAGLRPAFRRGWHRWIEARFSAWLALNPVPAVKNELLRLRDTAQEALGDLSDGVEIESSSLLRRQVARHCAYGVDRNRLAVARARLAIWVHTFVPGLPLSLLDHDLVHGDSLTGVGALDEVAAAFEPNADPDAPSGVAKARTR